MDLELLIKDVVSTTIRQELPSLLREFKRGVDDDADQVKTRQESAKYIRISLPVFDREVEKGRIKFKQIGGKKFFRKGDLDQYLSKSDVYIKRSRTKNS